MNKRVSNGDIHHELGEMSGTQTQILKEVLECHKLLQLQNGRIRKLEEFRAKLQILAVLAGLIITGIIANGHFQFL